MRSSSKPDARPDVDATEEGQAEAKAAFHLRMRARGVRDLAVLRAFELVPRDLYVPERHRDLAARDLPVPIACGQTMPEPSLVARMIEALAIEPTHKILEVGAGTGYATAILAALAEEVIGFERFQTLSSAACGRLSELEIENAAVVWGDGLALPGPIMFDRILVHGRMDETPPALAARLVEGGILVCGRIVAGMPSIIRLVKGETSDEPWTQALVCAGRLQPMIPGVAAAM